MDYFLSEFEYNDIKREVAYYCDFYDIKCKDYNSDFIFSNALLAYIDYKKRVDYLVNEKVICAVIKTITQRTVLNYIFKRNTNYDTLQVNDNYVQSKDIQEIIVKEKLTEVLNTIFSSLNEKEQALFELLSDRLISKNEACKFLNINKEFYENFINKLKKIVLKYI